MPDPGELTDMMEQLSRNPAYLDAVAETDEYFDWLRYTGNQPQTISVDETVDRLRAQREAAPPPKEPGLSTSSGGQQNRPAFGKTQKARPVKRRIPPRRR